MSIQDKIKNILVKEIENLVKEYLGIQPNLPELLEKHQSLQSLYLHSLTGSTVEADQPLLVPCTFFKVKPTEFIHIMVIFAIEEEFEIKISDEEAEKIKTVQQLIDIVSEKIDEKTRQ
ncbi:MAG TPA: hypothetical protein ENG03_12750 [Thioploca sp.]|nr:MAG: hypothetical protein B6247_27070 [Beggiatoa sp. 4572_84]RKZ50069.1 MAG: hypothetical protein DRR08_30625 [Gammaproteobacteria bacterium]HDN27935.1 hypothetical protein [Thioploca sp.]